MSGQHSTVYWLVDSRLVDLNHLLLCTANSGWCRWTVAGSCKIPEIFQRTSAHEKQRVERSRNGVILSFWNWNWQLPTVTAILVPWSWASYTGGEIRTWRDVALTYENGHRFLRTVEQWRFVRRACIPASEIAIFCNPGVGAVVRMDANVPLGEGSLHQMSNFELLYCAPIMD